MSDNSSIPAKRAEPLPESGSSRLPSTARRGQNNPWWLLILPAVVVGVIAGLLVPQDGIRPLVARWLSGNEAADAEAAVDESADAGGGVFAVSHASQQTFGLQLGKISPATFTQHVDVPAFVRERPTVSNLQASSRLDGVVRRIFVQVGQSVREGDELVELELTGDELASAQAVLLDSVQQLRILEDEIARLKPAAQDGGIVLNRLLEKQYEERRVKSQIESKRQELLVRGLSATDVEAITRDGQLVRTMTLRVPSGIRPTSDTAPTTIEMTTPDRFRLVSGSHEPESDEWVYSVESMNVSPGSVVVAGESLCDLAYHETLLIEGQAYERDLPMLTDLVRDRKEVSISVGDSDRPVVIDGLKLLFIDNHVDNDTQTYRFYIEVPNSVLTETIDDSDRRFRTWQFKPGQRGHVRLPKQTWKDRVILPAAAVAEDGVDSIVFRKTGDHPHFHGDEPPHSEFQKMVISVEYKDQYTVVVAPSTPWKPWYEVALNNSDMLMRASNEGGGGGHDHHGHEH